MSDDQNLPELAREFAGRLRKHLTSAAAAEPDETVERVIAIGSALVGVAAMVLPGKKRDSLALALVATAARHFAKGPGKKSHLEVVE